MRLPISTITKIFMVLKGIAVTLRLYREDKTKEMLTNANADAKSTKAKRVARKSGAAREVS